MSVAEVGKSLPEEAPLPESLLLWSCIGCGAMGNSQPCVGICDYRKLEIVSAEEYADAFEMVSELMDQIEQLTAMAQLIASVSGDRSNSESTYRSLQARARDLLRSLDTRKMQKYAVIISTADRALIWLCATCGQIEAPQQCLGICIRRNGEVVRADDHDKVVEELRVAHRRVQELGALVYRFAWVSPREGQSERTCHAFQAQARNLMQTHERPPGHHPAD
jgi:hypothetical protein